MAVVRANGKAGFDKHRLFYTQRDYGLFQCSTPCCQETFDNEAVIREMVERQENRKVPAELLPVCPHCGSPLTMNLRCDDRFVEDACWHRAAERYESFLRTRAGQRMLFLELGVGYNTPGIIKYPFWRMTARNPKATYACINLGEVGAPPEIEDRSILLSEDIGAALQALREAYERLDVINSGGSFRENGVLTSEISEGAALALKNLKYLDYYRIRDWEG